MKQKGMDFKHKEVISIRSGRRLGFVQDVCADLETGAITSIIVPGGKKLASVFNMGEEIEIKWQQIEKCTKELLMLF